MYPTATGVMSSQGQQVRGNGGVGMSPNAIERGSVQASLEEQERSANDLHSAISELEQRLVLILGPSAPSVNDAATAPMPPQSVMARIDQHNRMIVGARQRIGELMSRLEL